ncbi:hypothetical protein TNCV_2179721 [Trichonephila clavipes]|uniref:Uncharacterized protein n=1 Tax=Trichonephila clavipes TaxID=2585209 RepID=A0A8X7B800_TRICX|nr:hypothetical protein TNCV_2179721 [Trichonephila clavipes]
MTRSDLLHKKVAAIPERSRARSRRVMRSRHLTTEDPPCIGTNRHKSVIAQGPRLVLVGNFGDGDAK